MVNFRNDRHFGLVEDATGSHLVRYVGVAYIGNILIMVLFFFLGVILQIRASNTRDITYSRLPNDYVNFVTEII